MNKLSQECINEINKEVNSKWYGYLHYKKLEVKDSMIQALTNPTIYQSAGLMTVEEGLRFPEWVADNYQWIPLKKKFVHEDDYDAIELFETTELLTIFRNQNQEK